MGLGSSTRHSRHVSYYLNKLLKSEFFILLTLGKFFVFLNVSFSFYRTPNNLEEPGSPLESLLADLFPNAPRRPPPRRCINFDDSGFCNNLLMSPIKIIFDSDDSIDSHVSDDSGVIVISSDEFEEENDNDDDDNDGSINFNNAIDRSPSPPTPKRPRLL